MLPCGGARIRPYIYIPLAASLLWISRAASRRQECKANNELEHVSTRGEPPRCANWASVDWTAPFVNYPQSPHCSPLEHSVPLRLCFWQTHGLCLMLRRGDVHVARATRAFSPGRMHKEGLGAASKEATSSQAPASFRAVISLSQRHISATVVLHCYAPAPREHPRIDLLPLQ